MDRNGLASLAIGLLLAACSGGGGAGDRAPATGGSGGADVGSGGEGGTAGAGGTVDPHSARDAFDRLRDALAAGSVRAAEPDAGAPTGWRVNAWVKRGILLGFRYGQVIDMSSDRLAFFDKDTLPLAHVDLARGLRGARLVPARRARSGSQPRRGRRRRILVRAPPWLDRARQCASRPR
jgi:hypothetical protein